MLTLEDVKQVEVTVKQMLDSKKYIIQDVRLHLDYVLCRRLYDDLRELVDDRLISTGRIDEIGEMLDVLVNCVYRFEQFDDHTTTGFAFSKVDVILAQASAIIEKLHESNDDVTESDDIDAFDFNNDVPVSIVGDSNSASLFFVDGDTWYRLADGNDDIY